MSYATATGLYDEIIDRLHASPPGRLQLVRHRLDPQLLSEQELGKLWPQLRRLRFHENATELAHETAAHIIAWAEEHGVSSRLDQELRIEALTLLVHTKSVTEQLATPAGPNALDELRQLAARQCAHLPWLFQEFEVLLQLELNTLLQIGIGNNMRYWMRGSAENGPDPVQILALEAAYIDFAQTTLEQITRAALDVQEGRVPYKADGLCDVHEAQVIGRCARVGALRDEPWYARTIGVLLPGVSVAPTAAKTLPSQSLAVALGHAIEGYPTPEGLTALRATVSAIRHAGVKKKLERNVKPAERGLGARPELALRLALASDPDKKQDKKRMSMLAACLEAGWYHGLSLEWSQWHTRFAAAEGGKALACKLVWVARDADSANAESHSFMLDPKSGEARGSDGQPCRIPASSHISLWHPVQASDAEGLAWQRAIMREKIVQTPRQVFREYYAPLADELDETESTLFAGRRVSVVPLLGLSRREGWQTDFRGQLFRHFGTVRAHFLVDVKLYPGIEGYALTGALKLAMREGRSWAPVLQRDLAPQVFSEIARAVDLLVSVSGFGLDDTDERPPAPIFELGWYGQPPTPTGDKWLAHQRRICHLSGLSISAMGRARRDVCALVFSQAIEDGRLTFDGNRIRVGEYSVHVNTALVMKGNMAFELASVENPKKLSAMPWLPYDEVLLQKLVDRLGQLLAM